MKHPIILTILLALGLLGCNRAPSSDEAPSFITSPGTFKAFGGEVSIAVVETPEGKINFTVARGTSTAGPGNPLIRKDSAWFIYPASPDAVWMFDGEKSVLLIEFSGSGSKFTSSDVVPGILKRAPEPFLARLPPQLRGR